MKIVCFGDSNTYGYDPRSFLGGRYDRENRWVDIVANKTGWEVCNMGQNGRQIPETTYAIPKDTDLLIIMLGTNDILQGRSPESAALNLERLLSALVLDHDKILLIAPPPLTRGQWVPEDGLIDNSLALAKYYESLAKRLGIGFADAGRWNIALSYDGVHFSEQGHRAFAAKLLEVII